ncbi:MAG: QueT transporter family protein [Candidatus Bathyarchaeia archaeon]
MDTTEVSLTALIAALYAGLVIAFSSISFGPVQLRIADALIPLSAILGVPAIIGVSIGALIANSYYFLSPIDIILGTLANLIASYLIYRFRDKALPACIAGSFIIGTMVGSYLWLFFPPPNILGLPLPVWGAMIASVTLSSLIAVAGLGYILLESLRRSGLPELLKSRGVEV